MGWHCCETLKCDPLRKTGTLLEKKLARDNNFVNACATGNSHLEQATTKCTSVAVSEYNEVTE